MPDAQTHSPLSTGCNDGLSVLKEQPQMHKPVSKKSCMARQDHYGATIRKLETSRAALAQQLSVLSLEKQRLLWVEQVLTAMATQQNAMMREVGSLHQRMQMVDSEHVAPSQPDAKSAPTAAPLQSADLKASSYNYCAQLLRSAQQADIEFSRSLTALGWCEYFSRASAQLSLLLEVSARSAISPAAQEHQQTPSLSGSITAGDSLVYVAAGSSTQSIQPSSSHTNSNSGSNLQPPSYISSQAAAEQAIIRIVDDFTRMGLLAQIFCDNAAAYREASFVNLATGEREAETGFKEHWVQVARALQLTQEQKVSLQIAHQQFNRYRAVVKGKQMSTCQQVDADISWQLQRLGLCKPQQESSAYSDTASPAATGQTAPSDSVAEAVAPGRTVAAASQIPASVPSAAAAPGQTEAATEQTAAADTAAPRPPTEDSINQLQGFFSGLMVSTQMLLVHLANTLSYKQQARLLVASYPYLPQPGPILEGICNMILEDHQQLLLQQQQQVLSNTMQPSGRLVPAACKGQQGRAQER